MTLVFRPEREVAGLEGMDGVDPSVYRRSGLIRRGRVDAEAALELSRHLREDHGWDPQFDPADERVRKLRPEQQGAFPHDSHYARSALTDFLRTHARLHAAWGHDPAETL